MREQRTPATSDIVRYLLDKHGRELGIPRGAGKEVAYLSEKASISRNTARAMLEGGLSRPTAATRGALARVFSKVVPNIDESWLLDSSLEEFKSRLTSNPLDSLGKFLAIDPKNTSETVRRLSGTYVCYRHSFASASSKIVRSVLHIATSSSEVPTFRMTAPRQSPDAQEQLEHFDGVVVKADRIVYLIGRTSRDSRMVTMAITDAESNDRSARIGLLMTVRNDACPVAARIVLLKVDQEPNDLVGFMEQKTGVGSADQLLVDDYGATAARYIEYFIDNRLIGAEKEAELRSLEGARVHPDSTLRVEISRFYDEIPIVLQEARVKAATDNPD